MNDGAGRATAPRSQLCGAARQVGARRADPAQQAVVEAVVEGAVPLKLPRGVHLASETASPDTTVLGQGLDHRLETWGFSTSRPLSRPGVEKITKRFRSTSFAPEVFAALSTTATAEPSSILSANVRGSNVGNPGAKHLTTPTLSSVACTAASITGVTLLLRNG